MVRRFDEALVEFCKAEELDPLSPLVRMNIGVVLYNAKRYDEAISKLKEAKEMEQGLDTANWISALSYAGKSMFDEAITELETGLAVGETSDLLGTLGYVYGVSGKRKEALATLRRLERLGKIVPTFDECRFDLHRSSRIFACTRSLGKGSCRQRRVVSNELPDAGIRPSPFE